MSGGIMGLKKRIGAVLALIGIHGSLSAEQKHDVATAAYHAAPGAGASAVTTIAGLPLSDWLVVASLLFVVLQAGHLIWKWRRQVRIDAAGKAVFDVE
jgi:hypothetical protein